MITRTRSKSILSRKEFLGWAWAITVVGLVGQSGAALLKFFRPRVDPGEFGTKINAGQVNEFKPGTVSHVPRGRFFISRLEDGSILALWHRCTHLGCTVPWREDEGVFHCPCHSSRFDTSGEVLDGPAPRPLDTFPVEIANGVIIVDTSQPTQRTHFEPSQATPTI
ncbi:MAG TPA: ubiquinol-cytochrome c reductase iron-sulfur subunit [Anaerolineales bacterium]|jgi:cytochrome b6-f complex iron-sulfur subunit|nr:ubiquinol-cytochrome c reductase iron-sulfur subunit [Anaerolineales bacterium]